MSEHYDFHYQPTGSGAISGQQVLQQTEDAINELGDYVNDNVGGAMDVAQQALETAQTAETNAQTALDTANSFSSAIQSAQQDASTALSTAQTAQTTASNANNTAIQAQQDASSAVTTANNASGQVSTLSGTVTALGQRVTTAEGNIGQNTSDITALTTRVGTAEGNITTLQNDVSIAQGNASSAMATAGTVKQQSYVLRYSSTTLVASSTNSNSLLDNTDNLKVGDKVIDSSGVIYSVTAIDTANSTFTIGTSLIDLAQDSDVVHKSGDETISGNKTFTNNLNLKSNSAEYGVTSGNIQFFFMDKNSNGLSKINQGVYGNGASYISLQIYGRDENSQSVTNAITFQYSGDFNTSYLFPSDNRVLLGRSGNRWGGVYATNYYYGSNNVEFSTKFVTTDTNQTVSGNKTFSDGIGLNSWLYFTNTSVTKGTIPQSTITPYRIYFGSGVNYGNSLFNIDTSVSNTGVQALTLRSAENVVNGDDTRFVIVYDPNLTQPRCIRFKGDCVPNTNNTYECGTNNNKWKSFNGLEPSALGMPDLANGIDISSYIDVSQTSEYTASSNGYISICGSASGTSAIVIRDKNYDFAVSTRSMLVSSNHLSYITIPVLANHTYEIICGSVTTIDYAKFYPCLGNV